VPWLSISSCHTTANRDSSNHDLRSGGGVPAASSTPFGAIDRPDPSGDKRLILPHPDDRNTESLAGELPLSAFSCTKEFTGKRTNGTLRVSFRPSSPTDVALGITFDGCDYTGEVKLVNGRLKGSPLEVYENRCRRSPWTPLAVSCGVYLGSDLDVFVQGNGWGRTVRVRFPPGFYGGMKEPSGCRLPFVRYDEEGRPITIENEELLFDIGACKVEPP
jgi:hypothetical protein